MATTERGLPLFDDSSTITTLQTPLNAISNAAEAALDAMYVPTTIAGGANLNTYTTPGLFIQRNNADAASGTNYPAPYAGLLEVAAAGDGVYVYQTYTQYRGGSWGTRAFKRSFSGGAWGAWVSQTPLLARGQVTVTGQVANSPTSVAVTFPTAFPGTPTVVATANTTVPGSTVAEVSVSGLSATGFTAWVYRTNTTSTNVNWIAMYD